MRQSVGGHNKSGLHCSNQLQPRLPLQFSLLSVQCANSMALWTMGLPATCAPNTSV